MILIVKIKEILEICKKIVRLKQKLSKIDMAFKRQQKTFRRSASYRETSEVKNVQAKGSVR